VSEFEDALGYPLRGGDAGKRFMLAAGPLGAISLINLFVFLFSLIPLVGTVVALLSLFLYPVELLVIVVMLVLWVGYLVRVAREVLDGSETPPGFDDIGALVRDGAVGVVIGVAYALPVGVILAAGGALALVLTGGSVAVADAADSDAIASAGGALFWLVVSGTGLLSLGYGLAATYLAPISLCRYAREDSVNEAFSLATLRRVGTDGEYVLAWLAVVIAVGTVFVVQGVLTLVVIGVFIQPLVPFVVLYLYVAGFFLFARAYTDAGDGERVESTT
jgi:hypothetical protein